MTFESDMKDAEKIIINACEKTVRGTALRIFGEIIRVTPVGNPSLWKDPDSAPKGYVGGRLRNNWQTTIGSPASGEIEAADASGNAATSSMIGTVNSYDLNKSMFLTNNLPYADRVENGEWSKQRPQGMVKSTVQMFKPWLDKEAASNKV